MALQRESVASEVTLPACSAERLSGASRESLRATGWALQLGQGTHASDHRHAMTTPGKSAVPQLVIAALSILSAVFTGLAWLGQPLRIVQLLTLVGLGMTAGVTWARAIWRVRRRAPARAEDSVRV